MVLTATKHNLQVDPGNPSEEFKAAMPIWYHVGELEGRSVANSLSAKCLRKNHGVVNVGQCAWIARRAIAIRTRGVTHTPSRGCRCAECDADRRNGCTDPARCAAMAQRFVSKLGPVWIPDQSRLNDSLSLTPRRLAANAVARERGEDVVLNPSMTDTAPVTAAFRVFGVDPCNQATRIPARRRMRQTQPQPQAVTVYTDGSCDANGAANARAAAGVWFEDLDPRNISKRLPGQMQTNQAAEIYTLEIALSAVSRSTPLQVITDSMFISGGLDALEDCPYPPEMGKGPCRSTRK
ncbi:RNase H [Lentinus brumalis]|uniref:ribonuclease H n=1 Tax=Lentinus brumalis TaxID=2498619 RepID=A0A371DIT8_9APHY|nr:RNase H [Polyporus brumalis]